MMVFPNETFEKVDFENKSADYKNPEHFHSMQSVKVNVAKSWKFNTDKTTF